MNSDKLHAAFIDLQHAICGVFDVRHDSRIPAEIKDRLQAIIDDLEVSAAELEREENNFRIQESQGAT